MSDLVSQNLNMIFKTPKGETVHALKDVNFTLKKGELLTVLGPSGCGKTTLLNITAGFLRPTSGQIILGGNEINGPGVERGMVFQQGALFEWLTVAENVNFGLRMKKEDPIETARKVEEWLDIVGLQGFGNTPTYQLSGGMQQRVALARCLINDPDLILMDIQLPEVSGLEVTKWLKEDEDLRKIPVVAVTAFAMKGDEERIRQGGCEAYISKPISVMRFLETVKSYLGDG